MCIRHRLHRLRPSLGATFRLPVAVTTASVPFTAATFAIAPATLTINLTALAVTAAALALATAALAAALATTIAALWQPPGRRRVPESNQFNDTRDVRVRLVVGRGDGQN